MEKENLVKKSFRLSKAQILYLQGKVEQEKKGNLSSYLRDIIDADKKYHYAEENRKKRELGRDLIYEINHIGVNINQIVKNNNAQFYTDAEKRKLFLMMKKINDLLYEYLEE